ncbi:MAG TPA: PIN domain-containing protein [Mycobacterium sp.]|nr:PIN domain-containing protein [Mycobacterium sp.]
MALILDSGAITHLAQRSRTAAALIAALRAQGLWPALIPSAVLIECITGDARRDARTNRLLKTCEIVDTLPADLARRAAWLRTKARRGSAIDALVVASADPGGAVLTGDPKDLIAIADHADEVTIHVV